MTADQPIKPRTILAIADAWLKLDNAGRQRIREISPQLASNVQRLSTSVRSGSVVVETDDPYLRSLEAERRHTYVDYSLSQSHRPDRD